MRGRARARSARAAPAGPGAGALRGAMGRARSGRPRGGAHAVVEGMREEGEARRYTRL